MLRDKYIFKEFSSPKSEQAILFFQHSNNPGKQEFLPKATHLSTTKNNSVFSSNPTTRYSKRKFSIFVFRCCEAFRIQNYSQSLDIRDYVKWPIPLLYIFTWHPYSQKVSGFLLRRIFAQIYSQIIFEIQTLVSKWFYALTCMSNVFGHSFSVFYTLTCLISNSQYTVLGCLFHLSLLHTEWKLTSRGLCSPFNLLVTFFYAKLIIISCQEEIWIFKIFWLVFRNFLQ